MAKRNDSKANPANPMAAMAATLVSAPAAPEKQGEAARKFNADRLEIAVFANFGQRVNVAGARYRFLGAPGTETLTVFRMKESEGNPQVPAHCVGDVDGLVAAINAKWSLLSAGLKDHLTKMVTDREYAKRCTSARG